MVGTFGVKSRSLHLGLYIPRESENHVNVGPISAWDKRTPEDDKHPGSDHPNPSASIERSA